MYIRKNQDLRYWLKRPVVYQSEHEPFLPGNIAKRGVIRTISRKAISPLASFSVSCCQKETKKLLWFLKKYLFYFPDFFIRLNRSEKNRAFRQQFVCYGEETLFSPFPRMSYT